MPTTADFLTVAQWAGAATLVCAAVTVLAFIFKWGFRFRLVGATGFMGVLTAGLFALSLTPLTRIQIPGAVRYSTVFDNGATQVVIAVPSQITDSELEATLRQAASDLYSFGRLGLDTNQLTIRARTIIHPEPGISQPVYLGQVKRSLARRDDPQMELQIFPDRLAQFQNHQS